MKAYLLTDGRKARRWPFSYAAAEYMSEICGKPMLEWWFELFVKHGVSQALVNTHRLKGPASRYIREYNRRHTGLYVHEFYEPGALGSCETLIANRGFVGDERDFFICSADDFTNTNLTNMLAFHKEKGTPLTAGLSRSGQSLQRGAARLNEAGIITGYSEKPSESARSFTNAGIYAADEKLFEELPKFDRADLERDVLPNLIGKMAGYVVDDYIVDITSRENLAKRERARG